MKYKLNNKSGKCSYETYNNKTKSMVECGCNSNVAVGKNYICKEHLTFVLQSDKKPEVFALDGQEITIKRFKELVNNFKPALKKEVV